MFWLVLKVVKIFFPGAADAGSNAAGMIVLQILRICTVITFALMAVGCWFLLLNGERDRVYFVFESASLFFSSTICVFLILSEFPIHSAVRNYYKEAWPVLSEYHSVGWLGGAMVLLGLDLLGKLNKPSVDKIKKEFFQTVLAAGILALVFGIVNIVCAIVWRNGKAGITSRNVRSRGALAQGNQDAMSSHTADSAADFVKGGAIGKIGGMFWKKKASKKAGMAEKRINTGPPDVEQGIVDGDRRSPIAPEIRRPDTAMHPMNLNGPSGRSSQYSEAGINRF